MDLECYYADCGSYPSPSLGLFELLHGDVAGWKGPYARSVSDLEDPWGRMFRFEVIANRPVVRSLGPDGLPGTWDDVVATVDTSGTSRVTGPLIR